MSSAITDAIWINDGLSKYLTEKLGKIRIQVGVPNSVIQDERFVETFYSEYLPETIQFVKNVEQHWVFEKTLMEKQLWEQGSESEE